MTMGDARASRRTFAWLVAAATVLALALRALGVGCGLPAAIEDDAGVLVRQLEMVRDATPAEERDENWTLYPRLLAQAAGRFAPSDLPAPAGASLDEHLERAARTTRFVRIVVCLVSLLAVPIAYLLARRFVERRHALLAALLVATSLLFACFAQEARPHAAAAALSAWALLACVRLVERGTVGAFLHAGLACGAVIATLQSGVLLVVPLVLAGLLRGAGARAASRAWLAASLAVVAGLYALFVAGAGVAGAPDGGSVLAIDAKTRVARFFGHVVALGEFDATGFATVFWSMWSFEPVASALAALAVLLWLVRVRGRVASHDWFADAKLFVLVAWLALHLAAIGMYARTFERFALPLVVPMAVAAAWAVERVVDRARARTASPTIAFALVLVPLAATARLGWLRSRPLANAEAAAWLASHAEHDERVLVHTLLDLPLARTSEALAADRRAFTMPWRGNTPWRRYQSALAPDALPNERFDVRAVPFGKAKEQQAFAADPDAWLAATGARWVVLPMQALREGPELFRELRRACERNGKLAARFPARADGEHDVVLGFEDRIESARPHWTWSLLARAPIPIEVVEVWRLD